jgi:hypothetical protein
MPSSSHTFLSNEPEQAFRWLSVTKKTCLGNTGILDSQTACSHLLETNLIQSFFPPFYILVRIFPTAAAV